MSWWTDKRDSITAKIGIGRGSVVSGLVDSFINEPAKPAGGDPVVNKTNVPVDNTSNKAKAAYSGFPFSQFMRDNKWIGPVIIGLGVYALKRLFATSSSGSKK